MHLDNIKDQYIFGNQSYSRHTECNSHFVWLHNRKHVGNLSGLPLDYLLATTLMGNDDCFVPSL